MQPWRKPLYKGVILGSRNGPALERRVRRAVVEGPLTKISSAAIATKLGTLALTAATLALTAASTNELWRQPLDKGVILSEGSKNAYPLGSTSAEP